MRNQLTPPHTTETVSDIQLKLRGIEMHDGRLDLNTGTYGKFSDYVVFPGVEDTMHYETNDATPHGAWMKVTSASVLNDQRAALAPRYDCG